MKTIELTDETFSDLQALAQAFVDTPETVIRRLIDGGPTSLSSGSPSLKLHNHVICDPKDAYKMRHTVVSGVMVDAVPSIGPDRSWNALLRRVVEIAAHKSSLADVQSCVTINVVEGEKTDVSFRPIPSLGISLQGVDAVSAWRHIAALAQKFAINVDVKFAWPDKPEASHPGMTGEIGIPGKSN